MEICRFAFVFEAPFLEGLKPVDLRIQTRIKSFACQQLALAGLLTCPRSELPSHSFWKQWQKCLSKRCIGLTVAGLSGIFTQFPLHRKYSEPMQRQR